MRRVAWFACSLLWLGPLAGNAAECPGGRSDALGVSRTLVVDPAKHSKLGTMQYPETLPLADKEVVLTFDDGPLPRYSDRVLDILAAECVKATYFLVGRMAASYPDGARRIYNAGHTIGTHSHTHPFTFHTMPLDQAEREIETGIAATAAALGDPNAVAPFFRIPGLLRAQAVEGYLAGRGLMTWSADFPADDWKRQNTDKDIVRIALERLEQKRKGILLLHDIHPATALALPVLLRELKRRGYKIVHVVPAEPDRPQTVAAAADWKIRGSPQRWPRVASAQSGDLAGLLGFDAPDVTGSVGGSRKGAAQATLPLAPFWPRIAGVPTGVGLPPPDWTSFRRLESGATTLGLRGSIYVNDGLGPNRIQPVPADAQPFR